MRGRRDEQRRLADEALAMARDHGLLDAREVGEVHTAQGVALGAQGRHAEALPELERGVFLRRLWRAAARTSTDGLIALARGGCRRRRRRARRRAVRRGQTRCSNALPGPGVSCPARHDGRHGARPAAGERADSERERTILRLPRPRLTRARDRAPSSIVSYNTVHSHVKSLYRKLGVSVARGGGRQIT